MKIGKT